MKVRIIGHSGEPLTISRWWYAEYVGEVFDVEPDEERPEYYCTMRDYKGKPLMHHIRKSDCEVIEQEASA